MTLSMITKKRKSVLSKLLNIKTLFRYLRESYQIIQQGYRFKDKFTLFIYYLRIPKIVAKSLIRKKTFREIEEERKYLYKDVTLKNKDGLFFCGRNILTVYSVSENQEKALSPYFELPNGIFIDVGAHIGKYSIKLGRNKSVKVISLEPNNYNFSLLKKNAALNSLSNIITINKGAYFKKAEMPFYQSDDGDGLHSLINLNSDWKVSKIEVDSLDNIITELEIRERISLIKIDVEGAEIDVLKGMLVILDRDHPNLLVEILKENHENLNTALEILNPYNYNFQKIDEDNYFFS